MIRLTVSPGARIEDVCLKAAKEAVRTNGPVQFVFNDILITVEPKDTIGTVLDKYDAAQAKFREEMRIQFHADLRSAVLDAQRQIELLADQGRPTNYTERADIILAAVQPFVRTP